MANREIEAATRDKAFADAIGWPTRFAETDAEKVAAVRDLLRERAAIRAAGLAGRPFVSEAAEWA